jgi:hypothetical protein
MSKVRKGDIVTIKSGRSFKTKMRPDRAEGDLAGVKCMVLDEPIERPTGVSDKVTERVHVAPLEASEEPMGVLDIPTDNLRRPTGAFFENAGAGIDSAVRGVRRLFSRKTIYHRDGTTTVIERDFDSNKD